MALTTASTAGLRALGHTAWVMYANVATVWLVELPVAWIFGVWLGLGLPGLFAGYVAYFVVRSAVSVGLARYGLRQALVAVATP